MVEAARISKPRFVFRRNHLEQLHLKGRRQTGSLWGGLLLMSITGKMTKQKIREHKKGSSLRQPQADEGSDVTVPEFFDPETGAKRTGAIRVSSKKFGEGWRKAKTTTRSHLLCPVKPTSVAKVTQCFGPNVAQTVAQKSLTCTRLDLKRLWGSSLRMDTSLIIF